MYTTIQDFIDHFKVEADLTVQIFEALTEESLNEAPCSYERTIGRLAWHITGTLAEMMRQAGLEFDGPTEDDPIPDKVSEIIEAYKSSANQMLKALKDQWKDEELNDQVPMYNEKWRRKDIMTCLMSHQAHHRGQITVLMRQFHLKVPGIYGPSKDEWAELGMISPR